MPTLSDSGRCLTAEGTCLPVSVLGLNSIFQIPIAVKCEQFEDREDIESCKINSLGNPTVNPLFFCNISKIAVIYCRIS